MKKIIINCILILATAQLPLNAQALSCNCSDISLRKVTAKSGLVLRKLPSSNSEKVIGIPFNEKVIIGIDYDFQKEETIENIAGYWVRANYRGHEGFLFNGYLSGDPLYEIVHNADWEYAVDFEKEYMGLFTDGKETFDQGKMQFKKIKIDTMKYVGENEPEICGMVDFEEENYPYYVFTGLNSYERNIEIKLFEMEEGSIYPGAMRTIYYSGSSYTIYATGQVVKTKGDSTNPWETMVIKNYQVILERRSPDAVQQQVIMECKEMPVSYWGSGQLANIRLVGDLDGDAQPDFIFENYLMEGFEASLYLSSEAENGFLVKLVRKIFGACC
ncbi:MAG: SH3 domain-containing protein [Bacteroidota bacterium]